MTAPFPSPFAAQLAEIAWEAGQIILRHYAGEVTTRRKDDQSPVTAADEDAEQFILQRLRSAWPDVAVIAEEEVSAGHVAEIGGRFFLVDPLDGTKEFISRNGEFTVNIALVENGRPILGLVYAPAIDRLFVGAEAHGARVIDAKGERAIATRAVPAEGLTVVASRSHGDETALDAFLAGRPVASRTNAGSSLKLCLVAEGVADVYPRLGRTMEWDIAAGDAVLRAAGGIVMTVAGPVLAYGKPGFDNPHFAAWGRA
jgi:3'(2'), 5'-bisphosphate nucleotidase